MVLLSPTVVNHVLSLQPNRKFLQKFIFMYVEALLDLREDYFIREACRIMKVSLFLRGYDSTSHTHACMHAYMHAHVHISLQEVHLVVTMRQRWGL